MPQAMTVRFLGVLLAPIIVLAACGERGEKMTRQIAAPGNAYAIVVERTDLGACCDSRIVGLLKGFDGQGSQSELFEIKGSNDLSLRWDEPHKLTIGTCNATDIHHRSGIWKKDVSAKLFVSVINEPGKKTSDGIACELPGTAVF